MIQLAMVHGHMRQFYQTEPSEDGTINVRQTRVRLLIRAHAVIGVLAPEAATPEADQQPIEETGRKLAEGYLKDPPSLVDSPTQEVRYRLHTALSVQSDPTGSG